MSGFPYCGLASAYKKMCGIKETHHSSGIDFYCTTGTVCHSVFQRWLGQSSKILGDWKCYNKKCKHVVRFSESLPCPKCGSEMEYVEFEVKAFKHLSGHIDGVFRDKNGKYWIIDYKTCSIRVILSQKSNPTLPYSKNKSQIMAYCALIEKVYRIKIEGWALLYIARDDPKVHAIKAGRVSRRTKERILEKCKLYDDQFEVVQNIQSFKDLKYLIDTKPCNSYEFYSAHFKGFKGCPLESVCFTPHLNSVIKEAYIDRLK